VSGKTHPAPAGKEAALITVTGDGQARAVADQAVVLVAVERGDASAAQALYETAGRLEHVRQALLRRGLNLSDVQPMWANVAPVGLPGSSVPGSSAAYQGASAGQGPLPGVPAQATGFLASRGLQILLGDPNLIGEVVDTALAAGASFSSGGLLRLRDENPARSLALEAACQAAHAKAVRLATELGRPLGAVVSLVEDGMGSGSGVAGTGPVAAAGLSNGELLFHTRVRITYELG
jgi:uncharacterized protein YggE